MNTFELCASQYRAIMRCLKLSFCLFSVIFFTHCSSHSVQDYAENKPVFDVRTFFNGKLEAHGVVKNYSDKVIRSFRAEIDASWQDQVGTLVEVFYFDDGKIEYRTWTLTFAEGNRYTATANDVVGTGEGKQSGNAVFMSYVLRVPYESKTIDVSVDDYMFLVDDNTLIGQSYLNKLGFQVGEVVLTIKRQAI